VLNDNSARLSNDDVKYLFDIDGKYICYTVGERVFTIQSKQFGWLHSQPGGSFTSYSYNNGYAGLYDVFSQSGAYAVTLAKIDFNKKSGFERNYLVIRLSTKTNLNRPARIFSTTLFSLDKRPEPLQTLDIQALKEPFSKTKRIYELGGNEMYSITLDVSTGALQYNRKGEMFAVLNAQEAHWRIR